MSKMPTKWTRTQLVSLCTDHVDCVNRTAPIVEFPTPFKMLRTTNIDDGFIDVDNVRCVTESIFKRWTRRLIPKRNDVILTREAPLGDVGIIRTDDSVFLGQRLYHFRPDPEKLDPYFLLYSLLAPDLQSQIRAFGSGSTVEHMRLEDVPSLTIKAPDIRVQRHIASILSAYDELIENNRRRVRRLEELARLIYREWFVDFRFPSAKKVVLVDSEIGRIPHGWTPTAVTSCVQLNPKVKVPKEGNKAFVPMGSLSIDSMLISGVEQRTGNSGSKFQNGDTLLARITPCLENGKTAFVQFLSNEPTVAFGSTEFIVLRSRTLCPEFVYLLARSEPFRAHAIKSMSGATGRQRVQEASFANLWIPHPPAPLLNRFSAVVKPIFEQIFVLAQQSASLRSSRHLMLPKLMSGEIETSKLPPLPARLEL